MCVFDNILEHGASSTGFAAILGPASEEKTPYACALVSVPSSSQCFSGHSHRDIQTRTRTHAARHSTAQHGTAHLFHGNFELHRRERNRRTRALSWQSLLHDSPHTETHTHGQHAHTQTQSKRHHTHRRTNMYRHRHAHVHCDDPFPMRHSSFFSCNSTLERHHLTDAMGLSGDAATSSPRALGTFARKFLDHRGGVRVVFCPGMEGGGGAWTCVPVLVRVVPIGTGSPELDAVRGGQARLQLVRGRAPTPNPPGRASAAAAREGLPCVTGEMHRLGRQRSVTGRWRAIPA